VRAATSRVLTTGIRDGDFPAGDKIYLARLVSARTSVSQADAEKRVDDVIAKLKTAETKARLIADTTRKAGAYLSIFTGGTMLIGLYSGGVSYAWGSPSRRGLAR
jgi:hypothetical protein